MAKNEKESRILERLSSLSGEGYHGYYFIDILEDIIAEEAFRSECKHNLCGEVVYLEGSDSYKLKRKIAMVIDAMAAKGIIKISKSRKMFKVLF